VFAGVNGVFCLDVNQTLVNAPFTKKPTHNLGPIYFQKMMCCRVWVGDRLERSVVQTRVWCVSEAGSLAEHVTGSDEGEDKQIRRCRAPIVLSSGRGLGLGKRTRGMFGPRVVGEGMGRWNSESITATAMTNSMTSRPTNVTETNQCPAFVVYRTAEVRLHPHA